MTTRNNFSAIRAARWLGVALVISLTACDVPQPAPSVSAAATQRRNEPSAPAERRPATAGPSRTPNRPPRPEPTASTSDVIASVDHHPILRDELVALLLESRGAEVLEQLVALKAAESAAAARGITVTEVDVQAEYDRALRKLVDPLADLGPGAADRNEAERSLDTVLTERGLSRREYMLSVRLNAVLRRLAELDLVIDEADLRAAFDAENGERVEVRHIQLASPREASEIAARLAEGAEFADLARRHSANGLSAPRGGLLEAFSAGDERVPPLLREAAFRLEAGQVSSVLRVGPWHHILRLERRLPAGSLRYEDQREAVRARLRDRLAEPRMQRLYAEIFRKAQVRIHDPLLRDAFEKRHPDRQGS